MKIEVVPKITSTVRIIKANVDKCIAKTQKLTDLQIYII